MTITSKEVELIFGIPSGNKKVDMSQSSISDSAFGRRKFAGYKKVTAADLRAEIEECMEGTSRQAIEDIVRLMILHIVGCVLFVACADITRGWMFKLCDNLEELRCYDRGKAIVAYLVNYLNSKDAKDVRGCTVFLQVQLFVLNLKISLGFGNPLYGIVYSIMYGCVIYIYVFAIFSFGFAREQP